jgi:hypothetical protein
VTAIERRVDGERERVRRGLVGLEELETITATHKTHKHTFNQNQNL